jgi:hypothetical protein
MRNEKEDIEELENIGLGKVLFTVIEKRDDLFCINEK